MTLEPQQKPLAETDYLPDEGVFLEEATPVSDAAIQSTLERGKVVAITGQVEHVNRSTGEWALLTDQGVTAGKTAPGGLGLDGLQVGKRYRFKCAEVTEPDPLWRDRKMLYLHSVETA